MTRVAKPNSFLAAMALIGVCGVASLAQAQPNAEDGAASGRCAVSGSPNVFVEGRSMLRLGDVQGCPGLRYEVVPNVFINGQPAVRLLPSDDGGGGGADSVTVDGAPAARQGDAR